LQAFYRDRVDYPSARATLGVTAKELERLHQAALAALIESLAPTISRMPNQDARVPKP
jgi:hypothetical protein